jgi:hypothetical protein
VDYRFARIKLLPKIESWHEFPAILEEGNDVFPQERF